jgi:uncharacterized protein DUF4339
MFEDGATYYIRVRGRVQGPFDLEQLKKLRQRGQFSRAHEVSPDQATWQSASILDAVFASPKRAAPAKVEPVIEEVTEGVAVGEKVPNPPTHTSSTQPTWHYTVGEEQYGPVTLLELRKLVVSGEVMETDLVWKEGLPDWTAVADIGELRMASTIPTSAVGTTLFCFACGSAVDVRSELCPKCGVRQVPRQSWALRIILTVIGIIAGAIIGFFAAHHFAFFGGLALLGEPYSPARYSLVPGHILLCAGLLGLVGFVIGWLLTFSQRAR